MSAIVSSFSSAQTCGERRYWTPSARGTAGRSRACTTSASGTWQSRCWPPSPRLSQHPGNGRQPLEFDARLVPYRATGADVHVSFQRVGEVRMAKRAPAEEAAGTLGPGPSDA
ncbi:unnamed protein product, partial [Prorocentrum cordatum]